MNTIKVLIKMTMGIAMPIEAKYLWQNKKKLDVISYFNNYQNNYFQKTALN